MVLCKGVAFNTDILENVYKNVYRRSRLVVLFYHESFHYVPRKIVGNLAWTTPKHHKLGDYEAGYLMEKVLFGDFNKTTW
jgi:hypothetical protein